MEPLQFSHPAHSSPIRPERPKHHDTSRFDATDYDQRVLIDEVRPGMVQELFGKAVWLSATAFQNTVLPKPPQGVMPSDTHITAMTTQFREMVENFKSRAKKEHRKAEHVLADEFTQIVNEHVLEPISGLTPGPEKFKNSVLSSFNTGLKHDVPSTTATSARATPAQTSSSTDSSAISCAAALEHMLPGMIYSDAVPAYVMKVCSERADSSDPGFNKVDAAIFRKNNVDRLPKGRQNWGHQLANWEFKVHEGDPFDDRCDQDALSVAQGRKAVLRQVIADAERVFFYQHRTHFFSFFVIGSEFRCMRWDRSGVIITERIDYVKETRTFVELLVGVLSLDEPSQGLDSTATLLDEQSDEYKLMDRLAEGTFNDKPISTVSHLEETPLPPDCSPDTVTLDHVLEAFSSSVKCEWPRYKLTVDDENTFLVGRPIFSHTALVGRGTRGYVAWHQQGKTFTFLKDAWRPHYRDVETEGETLGKLNAAGVKNVPTLLCHGFVQEQATFTSLYTIFADQRTNAARKAAARTSEQAQASSDAKGKATSKGKKRTTEDVENEEAEAEESMKNECKPHIRHYAHYRMCVKEVCISLSHFKSSKPLACIVGDALIAHAEAFTKCNILHRDISSGNILIFPVLVQHPETGKWQVEWMGFLANWEMAKSAAEAERGQEARQPERTGTWFYMSVASLLDREHVVVVPDEIESVWNVLLHNGIRWLPHNSMPFVDEFIRRYFSDWQGGGHSRHCGLRKFTTITTGILMLYPTFEEFKFDSKFFNHVMQLLLVRFKARYDVLEYERKRAAVADATRSIPASTSNAEALSPDMEDPFSEPQFDAIAPALQAPSDLTREYAKNIEDHEWVLKLFRSAKAWPGWPKNEVKKDHTQPPTSSPQAAEPSRVAATFNGSTTSGAHQSASLAESYEVSSSNLDLYPPSGSVKSTVKRQRMMK